MKITVKVPKLGLTTESVALSEWVKAIGSPVHQGEVIALVEADKASVEVEAPIGGTLVQLLAEPGTELNIGDPLAVIEN